MKRAVWLAVVGLLVAAVPARSADINLVTNGDFSFGASGFGTEYVNKTPGTNDLWDPGVFTVATSAAGNHGLWETSSGHQLAAYLTGSANPFMLVNGYTDIPNKTVWSQTVAVDIDSDYFFEAFAKNLCCASLVRPAADLSFYINGLLIGSGGASGVPGLWTGISSMWNSHGATSANLEIRDGVTVFSGNDFGLDDIYFGQETTLTPAAEPASLFMFGSGLIGFGRLLLKRRKAARLA